MDLATLFEYQIATQRLIVDSGKYGALEKGAPLPSDNAEVCSYHYLHLSSEVGELMAADQRWKSHHQGAFDPEEKLEEMADVFIELMNVAIFSGISPELLQGAIAAKMVTVRQRAVEESEKKNET